MLNKLNFEVDGVKLCVVKPNAKQSDEGKKAYNKAFWSAVNSGSRTQEEAEKLVKERGLWGEEEEKREKELAKLINEKRRAIAEGGFITVEDGKEACKEVFKLEREMNDLRRPSNSLQFNTAEMQATGEQFNRMVFLCTKNEDNTPYFLSWDDYLEKSDDEVVRQASLKFNELVSQKSQEIIKSRPENKYLLENKLVNDKLQWINKDGKTVDEEGRLVNDEGYFVDENGGLVDKFGKPVDKYGNPVVGV